MEEEGKEAKGGWKVRRRGKEMGTYEEERGKGEEARQKRI